MSIEQEKITFSLKISDDLVGFESLLMAFSLFETI